MTNDHMTSLPPSENLDIAIFSSLFEKTTNSYKHLFFWSLLEILRQKQFDDSRRIEFREITIEMLVTAWYPYAYSQLEFGSQDMIPEQLNNLKLTRHSQQIGIFTNIEQNQLRQTIAAHPLDEQIKPLMRFVPYRLIRPFFEQELRGKKDVKVNREILELAETEFDSIKPLYRFTTNQAIQIHPEWAYYLKNHYSAVRNWAFWEWVDYMHRRNPNYSDIASKLLPPQMVDGV
ncbi:MAG: hypothetical protein Fur0025_42430 [Oscillatoriaceae cyanobacterium]